MGDDERVRAIKTEFISLFVSERKRFSFHSFVVVVVPRWAWHRLASFPLLLPLSLSLSLSCLISIRLAVRARL